MFAPDFLARTSDFPFLWGIDLDQRSSNIHVHLNVLESLWKHRCLDLIHRVSALVDLKRGLNCAFLGPQMMFVLLAQGSQHKSHWMLSLSASGNSSASIMSEMITLPELNVEITKISYGIFYSNKNIKTCFFRTDLCASSHCHLYKTVTHTHTHKHIHTLDRIHI